MKLTMSLAWLLLFAATVAADIATTTVRMRSESVCSEAVANSSAAIAAAPAGSPTVLRELSGVSDARVCSVECAVWPQCAVASYRPGNWTCLLGNLGAWQPCNAQPLTLMRTPTPPASLLSRLLGMYSFRFGLDNLVAALSPGTALPSAHATSTANFVYGRGVKLSGAFTSFMEVNLTGLGGRPFSSTGRATFYARVVPDFSSPSTLGITLHSVYNNSFLPTDEFNHTSKWKMDAILGEISFEAHDLSPPVYTISSGFDPYLPAGTVHSFAVVFDSANGARFYHNGIWSSTALTTSAATALAHGEEMLRIGYDPYNPFVGLILCYAVAADNLTLVELQELDQVC